MRKVGMLDLHGEYAIFSEEIRAVVADVLESQQFIGGPAIAELETALAKRMGVPHAVAVSSGTDALLCSMMALGIGSGDEVVLPTFSFFATGGAVMRLGAKPVFVDIDARTMNLDPREVESAITERTKAILVVHLFGQCAEMNAINKIAGERGIKVIEDAAQAIGATYHDRPACSLGDMACLSFYPTKNLGGFGEGGMVFVQDDALADVVRQLRNHGESGQYLHERVGGNFRLDTMKAAILLVKLKQLDEFSQRRRDNATQYNELLADVPVVTPYVADHRVHAYHQYTLLSDQRDELAAFLHERGVGCGIYYPLPLHLQPCFASLGHQEGSMPVAEDTCRRVLSLPCHPMLTKDDLEYVSSCIGAFHETAVKT